MAGCRSGFVSLWSLPESLDGAKRAWDEAALEPIAPGLAVAMPEDEEGGALRPAVAMLAAGTFGKLPNQRDHFLVLAGGGADIRDLPGPAEGSSSSGFSVW